MVNVKLSQRSEARHCKVLTFDSWGLEGGGSVCTADITQEIIVFNFQGEHGETPRTITVWTELDGKGYTLQVDIFKVVEWWNFKDLRCISTVPHYTCYLVSKSPFNIN